MASEHGTDTDTPRLSLFPIIDCALDKRYLYLVMERLNKCLLISLTYK